MSGKAITAAACPVAKCTRGARPHDTHRDIHHRPFWIAECGGCGARWRVDHELDAINAACALHSSGGNIQFGPEY